MIDFMIKNDVDVFGKLPNLTKYSNIKNISTDITFDAFQQGIINVPNIIENLVNDLIFELNKIIPNVKLNTKNLGFQNNQQTNTALTNEKQVLKNLFMPAKQHFVKIFQFINDIETSAGTVNTASGTGQFGYVATQSHVTSTGVSRFMNISASQRFILYLELCITLLGSYRFSYIQKEVTSAGVLKFNVINNNVLIDKFLDKPISSQQFGANTNEILNEFNNDISALREDRKVIESMSSLVRAYINRLAKFYGGKIQGTGFNKTLTTTNQNQIVLNERAARRILVSKQQTAISILELDDVQRELNVGALFSEGNRISEPLQRLLEKYCASSFLTNKESKPVRILTVGLCPGTNSKIGRAHV
jgi:hypothetical protein